MLFLRLPTCDCAQEWKLQVNNALDPKQTAGTEKTRNSGSAKVMNHDTEKLITCYQRGL